LRIAFIVTEFPALSETFILNQITGLLDLGHDVEIFAVTNFNETKVHPDVKTYGLLERTHYFFCGRSFSNKMYRMLKAMLLIIMHFHKAPLKILKSVNVIKYGFNAFSLVLLYAIIHFLDKEFDIIHCHFGPNGIIGTQLKEIGIGGKVVTTFHGYDMSLLISDRGENVYKKLFLQCDLCMPISNYWKKKLINWGCSEGMNMQLKP
jgi:colanic acid/amylovoran biosynthesis glycosyltransferase